ncbi:MAG TPA: TrmH family RNA methyltransferase [Candidatus Saccharimonadales bacterium]|jgi:tRNA G18 (ribose-2'-O)-methylase SpoU
MSVTPSRRIILIAHNLRSCHNVGSLLRTAEGLGVERVYLTGYTPYPLQQADGRAPISDGRLPHIATKLHSQIQKTALGAETFLDWRHETEIDLVLNELRADGWHLAAVEQSPDSTLLPGFRPPAKLALLVGREVEGVEPAILAAMDIVLEIPMGGRKESFNVVQAAAMALYHCTLMNKEDAL